MRRSSRPSPANWGRVRICAKTNTSPICEGHMPGKPVWAKGLVEDDGRGVGEVEGADSVVVGVDEVAADVLPEDGVIGGRGVGCLPGVGVLEGPLVRQHGNALAAVGHLGQQLLGNAGALLAKDEEVAVGVCGLGVGAAGLLGKQVQAGVVGCKLVAGKEVIPPLVDRDVKAPPIAQAGAVEHVVVEGEPEGRHEVKPCTRDHAGPADVSRVCRDLGFKEHDVEHARPFASGLADLWGGF